MKNKRKKLKIRQQILWSMIIISVCSAIFLGVISYLVSTSIIEKNYEKTYNSNLNVSSKITDLQLRSIVELMRNQLFNAQIMSALKESTKSNTGNKFFSVEKNLELTNNLSHIAGQNAQVEAIALISLSGESIFYYKSKKAGNIYEYYQTENILESDWVERLDNALGKEVFFNKDLISKGSSELFTVGKRLNDMGSEQGVGYMLINVRSSIFETAFGRNRNYKYINTSFVLDKQGENSVIFYGGEKAEKDAIVADYLQSSVKSNQYVFSSVVNDLTGWELVNAISKADLNKDAREIGSTVLAAFLFLFIVSTLISSNISKKIERPLNQLETLIEKVGDGERNITEVFDDSDIGKIGTKFKTVVNNNLELNEKLLSTEIKERESELLLLQSQINPHFLYNTLDSLYCMAIINNNDEIAEMVAALSNIFKLSLNKGNKLINIQDEVNHIREYMFIQNMRYNDRFELIIDIPEEILSKNILKLILQPFVENAVYHGLEPKLGKGKIEVGAVQDGNDLVFTITDNGVGIKDIALTRQGYGVKNVEERIKLFYGDDYGIFYDSVVGEGTTVMVIISKTDKNTEGELHEEAGSN